MTYTISPEDGESFIYGKYGREVWNNNDSWPGRLLDELPQHIRESITNITTDMVKEPGIEKPLVIEIGPGEGYTTDDLIKITAPTTHFALIEAKEELVHYKLLKKENFKREWQRFAVYKGNGWYLKNILIGSDKNEYQSWAEAEFLKKVGVIISCNALAIAANRLDRNKALNIINSFLDEAKELLFPHGAIVLTAGATALSIKMNGERNEVSRFSLSLGDIVETEFLKVGYSTSQKCKTHMWDIWLEALKGRGDLDQNSSFGPIYVQDKTAFKYEDNCPYERINSV